MYALAILRAVILFGGTSGDFITDYVMSSDSPTVSYFLCDHRERMGHIKNTIGDKYVRYIDFNSSDAIAEDVLYVYDFSCGNHLRSAMQNRMFDFPQKWLILSDLVRLDIDLMVDSDVVIAQRNGDSYILKEIYKYGVDSEDFIVKEIGSWSKGHHYFPKRRVLSRIRRDLNGLHLKTSTVVTNNDTLQHLNDYRNIHIDTITKFNYVLTTYLIEMMNCTRETRYFSSWGYKKENGYDGMIGSLIRKETEIGSSLFMTTERLPLIQYIPLTTKTQANFIFRQPPLSYVSNVFTLPFSPLVWCSTVLLVLLATCLLYAAVLLEAASRDGPPAEDELASLLDVVTVAVGGFCQQGATKEPRGTSGRIIMIFYFVALMFLYTSYSANIVALLQSSATNIRSLGDLLESRLTLGVDDVVYNHYYFKAATEPTRKAIYQKKIAPPGHKPHFYKLEDGIGRMREGFFAFYAELGVAYKLIGETFLEHEKCGIEQIPFMAWIEPWFAIRKSSPYKEIMSVNSRIICERGIQSREYQRFYTRKPECHTGGNSFVSVGLVESYAAFLVILIGGGLSLGMLLAEIAVHRLKTTGLHA